MFWIPTIQVVTFKIMKDMKAIIKEDGREVDVTPLKMVLDVKPFASVEDLKNPIMYMDTADYTIYSYTDIEIIEIMG